MGFTSAAGRTPRLAPSFEVWLPENRPTFGLPGRTQSSNLKLALKILPTGQKADTAYSASMPDTTPQAITEIIRYKIPENEAASFESAYRQAESVLQASPNCQGYELIRSDKDSQNYLLSIFWDSSDGHLKGFRKSDLFPKFLELIRPYIPMIQEMEHYHSTGMSWRRGA